MDRPDARAMDEVIDLGDCGFGILSRATAPGSAHRDAPMAVLLNAGLTHRTGPFRVYVQLARRLAAQGIDVLRFDLPRVGDGGVDAGAPEAVAGRVFDTLQRELGRSRFVIGGICSASDLAWRIAAHEPRVAGLLLYDAFADRGPWYRVGRLRNALRKPLPEWPLAAMRLLGRARASATGGGAVQMLRDWPEPAQFRAQAQALLQRDVPILAMYTGGVTKYLLHRRQLGTTFGRVRAHAGLELHFWPEFDHLLLAPDDRAHMLETVSAWCRRWSTSPRKAAAA